MVMDGYVPENKKTVFYDVETDLMWMVGPDRDTNWIEANEWVESLEAGWRLPNGSELRSLYEEGSGTRNINPRLKLTGWFVWIWETKNNLAWGLDFRDNKFYVHSTDYRTRNRVFAVRSYKVDRKLILMVGLPYSGKTTWALKYSKENGVPIVCPDAIRLAIHGERYLVEAEDWVWVLAKTMVKALFLAGHKTVIVDATNISQKRRDFWKSRKDANLTWRIGYKWINSSENECIKRAGKINDLDIIPVIRSQADRFEGIEEVI